MLKLRGSHGSEISLLVIIIALSIVLSLSTNTFLTVGNLTSVLNSSAVNIIFAVGLLVVLVSGGVDISFSVAASIVQYVAVLILLSIGGGNWVIGFVLACALGSILGMVNAFLIRNLKMISIIVTISTLNIYFGLLLYFTDGVSIYNLPDWLLKNFVLYEYEMAGGNWFEITVPVVVMAFCVVVTWALLTRTSTGRQLFAFGDNAEGARRFGINVAFIQYFAYGWLGVMAGIAGLMQVYYTKEVVPHAMLGRELDVLAAAVLGGARLGGGRGSVSGCVLGVLLVTITQNGLNLMGVSPFAFKMVVGLVFGIAITLSSLNFGSGRVRSV